VHLWVGNAKQAASYYTSRLGFEYYAYRGLETGEREVSTHVVRNEKVVIAFSCPYKGDCHEEMHCHHRMHGDGVKDIAFTVDDVAAIYSRAVAKGARSVRAPETLSDECGKVVIATIATYGDTVHTFVQREGFKGFFLPGFKPHPSKERLNEVLPGVKYNFIDHVVGNQPAKEMEPVVKFYEQSLDFHRFWSIDDTLMHTEYSSLNSIVVTNKSESVKMPINEPSKGKRKSQIQEYVDYYAGAGAQHIALNTTDIIKTVGDLRTRGTEFLQISDKYYDNLRKNLPKMGIKVAEDIEQLERNKILIDYDDKGYLLQIFTKPVEDRPTLFYEVIQRNNHWGFGAGNFKSLFECIEQEQDKRGNLTEEIIQHSA
jgi:4-hydroxyphenylpyruvate dioxygenase